MLIYYAKPITNYKLWKALCVPSWIGQTFPAYESISIIKLRILDNYIINWISLWIEKHTLLSISAVYIILYSSISILTIQQLYIISTSNYEMKFNMNRIMALLLLLNDAILLRDKVDKVSRIVKDVFPTFPSIQITISFTTFSTYETHLPWANNENFDSRSALYKPWVHVKNLIHILHHTLFKLWIFRNHSTKPSNFFRLMQPVP